MQNCRVGKAKRAHHQLRKKNGGHGASAPLPTLRSDDGEERRHLLPGSEIMPLATSLFQMNSTTSAPMVAVMKPAP